MARRKLAGVVNVYLPGVRETGIPTSAAVLYRHVWPGINAVFHGDQQQLEYDFKVAPGADIAFYNEPSFMSNQRAKMK